MCHFDAHNVLSHVLTSKSNIITISNSTSDDTFYSDRESEIFINFIKL